MRWIRLRFNEELQDFFGRNKWIEFVAEATMKQKHNKASVRTLGRAVLRANDRLDKKYPGEYVAYLDTWKVTKGGKKLSRKVLAHGNLEDINKVWAELPSRVRPRVILHYVDNLPPNTICCESVQVP
jgi:hypothetical protein